jgi:predicted amidohydrolase YtcJ
MLVPGFIDNHVHFLDGGYYLANIDLREAKSKAVLLPVFVTIQIQPKATVGSAVETGIMKPGVVNFPRDWIDSISGDHRFLSAGTTVIWDSPMGLR